MKPNKTKPKKNRVSKLTHHIEGYLNFLRSKGVTKITYGDLAKIYESCAKAVGQAVKALANRGQHQLAAMVVFAN